MLQSCRRRFREVWVLASRASTEARAAGKVTPLTFSPKRLLAAERMAVATTESLVCVTCGEVRSRSGSTDVLLTRPPPVSSTRQEQSVGWERTKEWAMGVCRTYMGGEWKDVAIEDFLFEPISGGLSNYLYRCSLSGPPSDPTSPDNSPDTSRDILLRVHGQMHDALMQENVIFTVLSERHFGPKLLGVFNGGRIEQFIPSITLRCEDIQQRRTSKCIAKLLARLHTINVPINKEATWIQDVLSRWTAAIDGNVKSSKADAPLERILKESLPKEITFLKEHLTKCKSKSVFCHNDLQEGNILRTGPDPAGDSTDFMFIDYEYCAYNYRTFDIANHFCEWAIDYNVANFPHFSFNPASLPAAQQQETFVTAYLKELECLGQLVEDGEKDVILSEMPVFMLASHLAWSVWAVLQAQTSAINFGYAEYAECRFQQYLLVKEAILSPD